jgi:hypothetical protein
VKQRSLWINLQWYINDRQYRASVGAVIMNACPVIVTASPALISESRNQTGFDRESTG